MCEPSPVTHHVRHTRDELQTTALAKPHAPATLGTLLVSQLAAGTLPAAADWKCTRAPRHFLVLALLMRD